ncbi:hypothetical protein VNO78_18738 [Psophocarpus tetragonolobus]|uniref:Uncharacterized protein n=1 Tax=Psophocarpus tetragonolobus TaxID=3891 RepID=A0AAN9XFV5_PSOTE
MCTIGFARFMSLLNSMYLWHHTCSAESADINRAIICNNRFGLLGGYFVWVNVVCHLTLMPPPIFFICFYYQTKLILVLKDLYIC